MGFRVVAEDAKRWDEGGVAVWVADKEGWHGVTVVDVVDIVVDVVDIVPDLNDVVGPVGVGVVVARPCGSFAVRARVDDVDEGVGEPGGAGSCLDILFKFALVEVGTPARGLG